MTINVCGKIVMQNTICEKCSNKMRVFSELPSELRCDDCGAIYKLIKQEINGSDVSGVYDFLEFRCIHPLMHGPCDRICLAPEMYCEQHLSDELFESARNDIAYTLRRLENTKRTLERMEESKKIWLIKKVSGI